MRARIVKRLNNSIKKADSVLHIALKNLESIVQKMDPLKIHKMLDKLELKTI